MTLEAANPRHARYANLVGRENVIAGSDGGYGTSVGQAAVDPDAVWAKFAAMAEAARIASRQSWQQGFWLRYRRDLVKLLERSGVTLRRAHRRRRRFAGEVTNGT